jgi:hypothetical protein
MLMPFEKLNRSKNFVTTPNALNLANQIREKGNISLELPGTES